jgi:acyl carrier protein
MNKLYEIINQILEENDLDTFDNFEDSHHLKNDLGLDSFNLAELTVLIEDEYGIDIFEGDLVFTIGDIKQKLNG